MTDERAHGEVVGMDHAENEIAIRGERIAQLEERIRTLEAEREWQPIETAPKDGTQIILAELDGGGEVKHIDVGCWDLIDEGWESDIRPYHGWTSNSWPFNDEGPNHWIPLPSPPDAARKGATEE